MFEALKHFTLVVQHRTFTAAARHANVSQPALTSSIQRLESQLGAKLFRRGPAGATLTAAGEALLPRARAALAAIDEGRRAVSEVTGLSVGSVRVGAGATVCTYYLPRTLARFRTRYPGVSIHLREAPQVELVDALEGGAVDLAILARTSPSDLPRTGLAREKWFSDELVLVAAPGVNAKAAPLVTLAPGASTRTLVDRYFAGTPIAMELGSISTVKENARAGVGVALISRHAVVRELASGHLVEISDARTPIARPLYIVHRGADRLPPAASALRTMLRDEYRRGS